jgi:uncharacterized protein (TIGR00159 family)
MLSILPGFLHISPADILDIVLVALIIYMVFRQIRGSSAMNTFIAIIILLIARIVADVLGMRLVSSLLGTVLDVGVIALIVLFQPEIRRFLGNIGRSAGNSLEKRPVLARLLGASGEQDLHERSVAGLAEACMEMGDARTGALIVLRQGDRLEDILATGDSIDAEISKRLILSIFFKNSPMHDGAMVIGGNRIMAARCTLPVSSRTDIPASYGLRHKAALGITEQTDADVIVVSEETGHVSFVRKGKVVPVSGINQLKLLLSDRGDENVEKGR